MKITPVREVPRKRLPGSCILVLAGLVCIMISFSSEGLGQSVNEYIDVSVGSDGTIYATGTTDAGWMTEHSAWVDVEINSPKGRNGSGYASVDSGGYVSADALLAFDPTDIGYFEASASGDGYCPVAGLDLGYAYAFLGIHESVWTGRLYSRNTTSCFYEEYCLNNTTPTCGPAGSIQPIASDGTCPKYIEAFGLYIMVGGVPDCFGLGLVEDRDTPLDCQ